MLLRYLITDVVHQKEEGYNFDKIKKVEIWQDIEDREQK